MKIRVTKIKNRMETLRALPYKGSMIYIRRIDGDMFTYDLVFKDEIYSSYIVMTPKPGVSRFSEKELNGAVATILAGAMTTIDMLLGENDVPEEKRAIVDILTKEAHES